jgi:hypothetical protein
MTSRPSRLVSAVRAALVVAVACVATLGGAAVAQGATLQADFDLGERFTISAAAPETTIDSGPEGSTNDETPEFGFTGTDAVSFECRHHLVGDTAPSFVACSSPHTLGPLVEGEYLFQVRAVDAANTPDPTPAGRAFTVDTTAPETTIDAGPAGPTNDVTPDFAFSSSEVGTFECWEHPVGDTSRAFAPCSSPRSLGPLTDGAYVFEVRAIDAAGNPDGSPASQTFAVDATAPDTSIASGPAGLTNDATPGFSFTGTEAGSFECRYHPIGEPLPAFAPCSSPHSLGPLGDAGYVFEVAAIDVAGNRDGSAATRTFTVDTTAPATEITGGPGDTTSATAVFLFSAPGAAGFSCRLDGGPWRPCSSPESYAGLSLGRHRFEVRAVDEAGNEDASPATHDWQVLRPGLVIPGTLQQATALARELVQMRRALSKIRLRTLGRRRAVTLRGFDALTAGTVEVRATDRLRRKRGRRRVTLLLGKREIPRAGRYPVRASVTTKGRRLARRRRTTLPVQLRLSFTDLAGRSLWATAKLAMKP